IARAPDRQGGEAVGIDEIEKARRIRSLDIDLPECRDIGDADTLAPRARLIEYCRPARLARVDERAQPQSRRYERSARGLVPLVQGHAAPRAVVRAYLGPGERREWDGLREGARAQRAHLCDRHPTRFGEDRTPYEPANTSLVGGHAECRVALHVLEMLVAFLGGEAYVITGHIVLQVDEGFASRAHLPQSDGR